MERRTAIPRRNSKVDIALGVHDLPNLLVKNIYNEILTYEITGQKSETLKEFYRTYIPIVRYKVKGIANWEWFIRESILFEVIYRIKTGDLKNV